MSAISQDIHYVLQALAGRRWALCLLFATGCSSRSSLNLRGTDSSVDAGGGTFKGGTNGQGGDGNTSDARSEGVSGGITGIGGLTGDGGTFGSGGLPGSGGLTRTGGGAGTGGILGTGGAGGKGGSAGTRGTGGLAVAGGSGVFGMPCTTKQDCPSNSTCCDGSDPNCAGTRLPSGEGVNPGEFVVSADSLTVTDTITGLVWQRDGLNCIGNYTWAEAEAYCASLALGGLSGWRLPAWAELLTILDFTTDTFSATIDQTAFPGTDTWSYWTSSLYTGLSFEPLYVSFDDGSSAYCSDSGLPVRCVRGSRCYPKARFVVIGGGLVRDMLTALVWQQQASVAKMTWADAQNYCSSLGEGFRLPTLKELDSLVDPTVTSGPSLDKTAFPNNGTGALWTSSPYRGVYASSSGDAHFGDFTKIEPYFCDNGFQNWISVVGSIQVRCVR